MRKGYAYGLIVGLIALGLQACAGTTDMTAGPEASGSPLKTSAVPSAPVAQDAQAPAVGEDAPQR